MAETHRYTATSAWSGSTGAGYEAYERTHRVTAPPAQADFTMASDPAFRGDFKLLNPEQLVVIAASSCQLLSFLAVAARARIDVRRYEDEAEGVMPEDDPPLRITRITLRPHISVTTGPTREQVEHLVEVAHRECFIANSLRTEVVIEPTVEFVP
jgi:organic hydroperoxide reductase OsmC/OhrA